VNNIIVAVKDRPLCRSVVLHKDRAGRLGIQAESTTESSRAGTIWPTNFLQKLSSPEKI
jgi:hypothetical protein